MTHSRLRALLLVLSCATSPGAAAAFGEDPAALGALDGLVRLNGEEYAAQRSALIRSHPQPWDVSAAAGHSWEAGLAALIVNARLAAPNVAAAWDALRFEGLDHAGRMRYDLDGLPDGDYQLLSIEELWRPRMPPAEKSELTSLGFGKIPPGPPDLWYAVWEHANLERLRSLALSAIARDQSARSREVLAGVLSSDTSPVDQKGSAMKGLSEFKPPYATDLLLATTRNWRTDTFERSGFLTLLRQPDPRAAQFVRGIARDTNEKTSSRLAALRALALSPQPEDLDTLRGFLNGPEVPGPDYSQYLKKLPQRLRANWPPEGLGLKSGVIQLLSEYPRDFARPLIQEVLRNPPTPHLFRQLARALPDHDGRVAPEERDLLEELMRDGRVPDIARNEVVMALDRSRRSEETHAPASQP